MTPATIRVAFDSGWSDGDPGNGRVRFDAPRLVDARHIYVNARDAQDAILDEWVPTWGVGDVLIVERAGAERNRVIAWVVGAVYHRGSYWRIPVKVRTVYGAFAAHDELLLHRAADDVETEALAPPASPPLAAPRQTFIPLAPLAPLAAPEPDAAPLARGEPQGLVFDRHPSVNANGANGDRLAQLEADNRALHDIIARLVSDDTTLYLADGTR